MARSVNRGMIYVILSAVLWGVFPLFARNLYAFGATPVQTAAMRAYITAAIYIVYGLIKGKFRGFEIKYIPFYIIYGILAVFGTYIFYALAIEKLSSSMAAILLYTAPAFVTIFSRIIYREPITRVKVMALILIFLGSFIVVRGYDFAALELNATGIVFGLMSGLCYSSLTLFGRHGLKKYPADTNAIAATVLSTVAFIPICPPWSIPVPEPVMWISFIGIAVIGSVLPYLLYLKGMELGVEGGHAIIVANIEPLVATIAGVIAFGDFLEIWQVTGIIVTLLGAALPTFLGKRKAGPKKTMRRF